MPRLTCIQMLLLSSFVLWLTLADVCLTLKQQENRQSTSQAIVSSETPRSQFRLVKRNHKADHNPETSRHLADQADESEPSEVYGGEESNEDSSSGVDSTPSSDYLTDEEPAEPQPTRSRGPANGNQQTIKPTPSSLPLNAATTTSSGSKFFTKLAGSSQPLTANTHKANQIVSSPARPNNGRSTTSAIPVGGRESVQNHRHKQELTPESGFNVNMGTDPMHIKAHHEHHHHQQPAATTKSSVMLDESLVNSGSNMISQSTQLINERRQDMIYANSATEDNNNSRQLSGSSIASRASEQMEVSVPNICYTPIVLLMVVLVTMMITVVICFCTHMLIRHLGRHRFDLIESSKHFNGGYLAPAGQDRRTLAANKPQSNAPVQQQLNNHDKYSQSRLNLLVNRREPEFRNTGQQCAFDNPYFTDETSASRSAEVSQRHSRGPTNSLLATAEQFDTALAPASQQLHCIEHHISNLHNKQVTSSVKELSIIDSPGVHVVNLASKEHQAKVIADPKEGDLVAVDITGQDFIGLGFELCGNPQDGIFIRSVLSNGPARESGCVHPGDRIKCLNISFDRISLEDANDMLTCGAPYRMRLLLEKRALPAKELDKLASPMMLASRPRPVMLMREPSPESTGLFSSYLKRITRLVAPKSESLHYQPRPKLCQQVSPAPVNHHFSNASDRSLRGHLNGAYGADDFDESRSANSVEQLPNNQYSSQGVDSLGSNLRARFSLDSTDKLGSSINDYGPESSLDFHSRNAHHQLHGPQVHDRDNHQRNHALNSKPINEIGLRRQSVNTGDPVSKMSGRLDRTYLEQTQSHPEIASIDQPKGALNRVLEAKKVDKRVEMSNSVSTPTMNIFVDSGHQ